MYWYGRWMALTFQRTPLTLFMWSLQITGLAGQSSLQEQKVLVALHHSLRQRSFSLLERLSTLKRLVVRFHMKVCLKRHISALFFTCIEQMDDIFPGWFSPIKLIQVLLEIFKMMLNMNSASQCRTTTS